MTSCDAQVLADLAGQLDDRHDRRAGALGDGHRVADVVGVAVGERRSRRRSTSSARGRGLRVAGQERVDEHGLAVVLEREGGVAQEADVHASRSPRVVVSRLEQLAGELEPDGDADEHAQARLLGDQRAHRAQALVGIVGARRRAICASWASPNQPPAASASLRTRCRPGAAWVTISWAWAKRSESPSAATAASTCSAVNAGRASARRAYGRRSRARASSAPDQHADQRPGERRRSRSPRSPRAACSSSTTAMTAVPSRSPSCSSPRRAREEVGHRPGARASPSAAPLPPKRAGSCRPPTAQRDAAHPAERRRARARRAGRGAARAASRRSPIASTARQLVPDVRVDERRRRDAPPVAVERPGDRDVAGGDDRQQQEAEQRQERRAAIVAYGPPVGSPRMPGISLVRSAGRGASARFGRFGCAARTTVPSRSIFGARLRSRVAAVRALGDVRADLGPAVLADDEQVGRPGHGCIRF